MNNAHTAIRKGSELDVGNIVVYKGRALRVVRPGDVEATEQGPFCFLLVQDLVSGSVELFAVRATTLLTCRVMPGVGA